MVVLCLWRGRMGGGEVLSPCRMPSGTLSVLIMLYTEGCVHMQNAIEDNEMTWLLMTLPLIPSIPGGRNWKWKSSDALSFLSMFFTQ